MTVSPVSVIYAEKLAEPKEELPLSSEKIIAAWRELPHLPRLELLDGFMVHHAWYLADVLVTFSSR